MPINKLNCSKGFTLVEITIAVIIVAIIITLAYNFFSSTLNAHNFNNHVLQNVNSSTPLLQMVADEIKYANSYSTPSVAAPLSSTIVYSFTDLNGLTYQNTIYLSNNKIYKDSTSPSGVTTTTLLSNTRVTVLQFLFKPSISNISQEVSVVLSVDDASSAYSKGKTMKVSTDVLLVNYSSVTPSPIPTP